jgi:hypothetical protein
MWCKHKEDCIAKLRKTTYEERVTLQVNSAASGGIRRTAKMKVWKENSPIMSAGPRSRFTMKANYTACRIDSSRSAWLAI